MKPEEMFSKTHQYASMNMQCVLSATVSLNSAWGRNGQTRVTTNTDYELLIAESQFEYEYVNLAPPPLNHVSPHFIFFHYTVQHTFFGYTYIYPLYHVAKEIFSFHMPKYATLSPYWVLAGILCFMKQ